MFMGLPLEGQERSSTLGVGRLRDEATEYCLYVLRQRCACCLSFCFQAIECGGIAPEPHQIEPSGLRHGEGRIGFRGSPVAAHADSRRILFNVALTGFTRPALSPGAGS